MNEKVCPRCGKSLPATNEYFHSKKTGKYGVGSYCKPCMKEYSADWYDPTRQAIYRKLYRAKNPDYDANWSAENKDKVYTAKRKYKDNNREKINAAARKRHKEKCLEDPSYKILNNLRCRLTQAIRKNIKADSTKKLIGCSVEFLKEHLESQFLDGMTWENYGVHGWHIDHITPCAIFDFSKPEHQRICFHYSNLRPLWAIDNIRNGSKLRWGDKYERENIISYGSYGKFREAIYSKGSTYESEENNCLQQM